VPPSIRLEGSHSRTLLYRVIKRVHLVLGAPPGGVFPRLALVTRSEERPFEDIPHLDQNTQVAEVIDDWLGELAYFLVWGRRERVGEDGE